MSLAVIFRRHNPKTRTLVKNSICSWNPENMQLIFDSRFWVTSRFWKFWKPFSNWNLGHSQNRTHFFFNTFLSKMFLVHLPYECSKIFCIQVIYSEPKSSLSEDNFYHILMPCNKMFKGILKFSEVFLKIHRENLYFIKGALEFDVKLKFSKRSIRIFWYFYKLKFFLRSLLLISSSSRIISISPGWWLENFRKALVGMREMNRTRVNSLASEFNLLTRLSNRFFIHAYIFDDIDSKSSYIIKSVIKTFPCSLIISKIYWDISSFIGLRPWSTIISTIIERGN